MRTLEDIKRQLENLEGKPFNFNPLLVEQGSPEWHFMKLGVVSASNITAVLAGKKTAARNTYMCTLVGQIIAKEAPEVKAKQMEWGKNNELAAQSSFEFATGLKVENLPFVFAKDKETGETNLRYGFSPDGYGDVGLELKCPYTTAVFVDFVANETIKPEYLKQCRFSAWVAGRDSWEFANFDPRSTVDNFHIVRVNQCDKFVKDIEEKLPEFLADMDIMLNKFGKEFDYQWT